MTSIAIYREQIRFDNAKRFVQDYRLDNSSTGNLQNDNHLYVLIGREIDPQGEDASGTPYSPGDGVWPNSDQDVSAPVQTEDDDRSFWSMVIGAKKVDTRDVCLMVPRRDWTSGTTYAPRPKNSTTAYDTPFYVMNSLNEVFMVVARTGSAPSTVEPVLSGSSGVDSTYFKDGKQSLFVSGTDGYTWKYLYKMTPYLVNTILEDEWMPVPMGDNFWSPSGAGERTRGRDDAYLHLGARWVLIRGFLDAGIDGSGKLPAGLSFRQVMFVSNPLLNDPVASNEVRATGDTYFQRNTVNGGTLPADDELRKYTGAIIYKEARNAVFRQVNQSEEVKTLFVF